MALLSRVGCEDVGRLQVVAIAGCTLIRACPKKRNVQSTWGLPRHMGGVRQAARCPYGAAEPSWAMVRCYSSSHPPIQYTACVGLSHIFQKVTPKEKNHPPGLARDWSISVRPRTNPWRRCGWCPRTAPLIIDIKRRSGTRGVQLCRCKAPPKLQSFKDFSE